MQSTWKREGERQERVSGSETDSSQLAEREDETPCSRQRAPQRPAQTVQENAKSTGESPNGRRNDSQSHRAPPADCVLLLKEQSNPKQMTFHPPRVQAHAPLRSPLPTPAGPQAHPEDTRPADNLSRGNTVLTRW